MLDLERKYEITIVWNGRKRDLGKCACKSIGGSCRDILSLVNGLATQKYSGSSSASVKDVGRIRIEGMPLATIWKSFMAMRSIIENIYAFLLLSLSKSSFQPLLGFSIDQVAAPSYFQTNRRKRLACRSTSKQSETHAMTGWRVGCSEIIGAGRLPAKQLQLNDHIKLQSKHHRRSVSIGSCQAFEDVWILIYPLFSTGIWSHQTASLYLFPNVKKAMELHRTEFYHSDFRRSRGYIVWLPLKEVVRFMETFFSLTKGLYPRKLLLNNLQKECYCLFIKFPFWRRNFFQFLRLFYY